MMNKKGFAFVETIVTVVILSTSLLYLYSTYNVILNDENTRLYYDDPAFIYSTNYVRKFLEEYSEIDSIKRNYFDDTYIVTLGSGFNGLFSATEMANNRFDSLNTIVNSFKINQILLVKSTMFDNCFEGNEEYCSSSISNLNYNLKKYVNSLSDTTYDYYLVVEYSINEESNLKCIPGVDKRCKSYYASLGI